MSGYPDGTFQPTKPITRAEVISVLARAVGTLYNRAGTYGPVQGKATLEGNVTITTPGVTLQNTNIIGNLYLTEGIEEGDVTMKNVTVQGATKIGGGGSDSIHLRDSKIGNVLVNVPSRKLVRILVRGKTMVGTIEARTPVRLEEEELTGSGFTVLRIRSVSLWADAMVPVELSGQLDRVEIEPAQLPQSTQSVGTILNLSAQSVVDEIIANAPATVQGQGTVQTLWANVDGVVVEAQVKNVHPAPGVQTMVNGIIITEDYQYIESKKKKSKDASLSDITINGTTISDFAVDTLSYEVELPYGTPEEEIPIVAATAHHAKARVQVTQATSFTAPDNVATVLVTAENGRTQTYTVTFTVVESSAKAITALRLFADLESDPVGIGIIDEEANPKTITVTVPFGTTVTDLIPVINHTGVRISPESGTPQDFTAPVTYTVTAEDGSTAQYTVTVTIAPNTEADITSFSFTEQTGPAVINSVLGTIEIEVEYSTDRSNLVATFTLSPGATVTVNGTPQTSGVTANDFSSPVEYLVTAGSGTTKTWTVYVSVELSNIATVSSTEYTVSAGGTANETISNVPYGTSKADFLSNISKDEPNQTWDEGGISDPVGDGDTLVVTAQDNNTTVTYTIHVLPASSDASLSEITLDGTLIDGFDPETTEYEIELPAGTMTVPEVGATAHDEKASLQITQAESLTAPDNIATIVVTAQDGTTKTYTVSFIEAVPVTGVTLDQNTLTLAVGEEETLTATVLPENASNKEVSWESSDSSVATVDENGKVTAVSIGTATITVTTADGSMTDNCEVTVNPAPIDDFARSEDDGTSVTFGWTTAEGATSIKIEQATYNSADGTWSDWEDAYTVPLEATASTAKVVGLTARASYKFRLVVTGGDHAGVSNEVEVTTNTEAANTYGARWPAVGEEDNNLTTMTRLGQASGKTAGDDFDDFAPWGGIQRESIDGQVMVKIPKFYYKRTWSEVDLGEGQKRMVHEFWVADGPAAGFKLHPAFIRAGEEIDCIYMGAYKASFDTVTVVVDGEDEEKDTLASRSGAIPAVSKTRPEFRALAEARGEGWTLSDILTRNAVALLYLVEYADTNSQATIGQGITGLSYESSDTITKATENENTIFVTSDVAAHFQVGRIIDVATELGERDVCQDREITEIDLEPDEDGYVKIIVDGLPFDTAVGNVIYHVGQRTGGCDGLENGSGSANGLQDDPTVSVSYRGIEGLWGNVWEFVDGMNILDDEEKQPYITDDYRNFDDDVFDGKYQATGLELPLDEGFWRDFACPADADWLLMPSATGETETEADANTYIPDYFHENWGNWGNMKVALVGGTWDVGYHAGIFRLYSCSTSEASDLYVGARLLYIPQ